MRPLKLADPVGTRVVHTDRRDDADSSDAVRQAAGRLLGEHHPGTVTSVHPHRGVTVSFLALESEPISRSWFRSDEDGCVPGLVVVGPEEWEAACASGWWAALRAGIPAS